MRMNMAYMKYIGTFLSLLLISGCNFESLAKSLAPQSGTTTRAPSSTTGSSGGGGAGGGTGGESGYIGQTGYHGDGGYVLPVNLLFCGESGQIVLKKGQGTLLTWAYPDGSTAPTSLNLSLEATPSSVLDYGTVTSQSAMSAWYQAPASIPVEFSVAVRAQLRDGTVPAVCTIHLIADEDLGMEDDGLSRGAVGLVYELAPNTPSLPDFSTMTPIAQILIPSFDVATRAFSSGFPGVPDLFEWFGIAFSARLVIPADGNYAFRLNSDDGSKLWIDGNLVINNDGTHAPRAVDGSMNLTAGNHNLKLDYFQGPRYHIALELFWKKPGDSAFTLIPPDAFLRPAP